jgi:hypothetical protein
LNNEWSDGWSEHQLTEWSKVIVESIENIFWTIFLYTMGLSRHDWCKELRYCKELARRIYLLSCRSIKKEENELGEN